MRTAMQLVFGFPPSMPSGPSMKKRGNEPWLPVSRIQQVNVKLVIKPRLVMAAVLLGVRVISPRLAPLGMNKARSVSSAGITPGDPALLGRARKPKLVAAARRGAVRGGMPCLKPGAGGPAGALALLPFNGVSFRRRGPPARALGRASPPAPAPCEP